MCRSISKPNVTELGRTLNYTNPHAAGIYGVNIAICLVSVHAQFTHTASTLQHFMMIDCFLLLLQLTYIYASFKMLRHHMKTGVLFTILRQSEYLHSGPENICWERGDSQQVTLYCNCVSCVDVVTSGPLLHTLVLAHGRRSNSNRSTDAARFTFLSLLSNILSQRWAYQHTHSHRQGSWYRTVSVYCKLKDVWWRETGGVRQRSAPKFEIRVKLCSRACWRL